MSHKILIEGFHSIQDKNALAWVALDTKFERFALAAIAASINRQLGRIAHLEFPPRMDLAVLDTPLLQRPGRCLDGRNVRVKMRYEGKAGQLFDFAPPQRTDKKYLGGDLDSALARLPRGGGAGVFFIADADDPCRHLKYYRGHRADLSDAIQELQRNVPSGTLAAEETIDCGTADGTTVRIHMYIFDRI